MKDEKTTVEGKASATTKPAGSGAVTMPHDKGYKRPLEIPKQFLHFLKKYVKADWAENLTEDQLVLCDKEFIDRDYEGREADIIYRIHKRDGTEIYVFVLQELQSYVDYTMVFRILVYMVNHLTRYFLATDKKVRERSDFRLPAMIPIVFYNGEDSWTPVRKLRDYLDGGSIFGEHVLNMEYYLVDLHEIGQEDILATNLLIDNIMYCDKFRRRMELIDAMQTAHDRIGRLDAQDQEEFVNWTSHILLNTCQDKERVAREILGWVRNGDDDMAYKHNLQIMLENEMAEARRIGLAAGREEGLEKGIAQGREEGRKEGRAEGSMRTIVAMVCRKLKKNQSPQQIAEELEEDIGRIQSICEVASAYAPDYNEEQICKDLVAKKINAVSFM